MNESGTTTRDWLICPECDSRDVTLEHYSPWPEGQDGSREKFECHSCDSFIYLE